MKCKVAIFVLAGPAPLYGPNLCLASSDQHSFLCFHTKRYVCGTQGPLTAMSGVLTTLVKPATAEPGLNTGLETTHYKSRVCLEDPGSKPGQQKIDPVIRTFTT